LRSGRNKGVKLPASLGLVENVTVNDVAVAAVTVPNALLLKTTVLLLAIGSKPKPLIVIDSLNWFRSS
jgi:hypothetical protein